MLNLKFEKLNNMKFNQSLDWLKIQHKSFNKDRF